MIDNLKAAQDALVYTESYAKEVAAKEAAEKTRHEEGHLDRCRPQILLIGSVETDRR